MNADEKFRADILKALATLSNEIATIQFVLTETEVLTKAQLKNIRKDARQNLGQIQAAYDKQIGPLRSGQ